MTTSKDATYTRYLKSIVEKQSNIDDATSEALFTLLSEMEKLPVSQREDIFLKFLTQYIESNNDKSIGFQLGKSVPLTAFGNVGYAYRVAPTILEALKCIADYHQEVTPLVVYSLSVDSEYSYFSIGFKPSVSEIVESTMVCAAVTLLHQELLLLCGNSNAIDSIQLSRSSQELIDQYKEHFGVSPIISDKGNFVRLRTAALQSPNPLGDPETFKIAIEELNSDSKTDNSSETLISKKVARLISSSLTNPPSFKEIAKILSISERQLRFALQKEETSFQKIIRGAKVEYASFLLQNRDLQISQIAAKMGYKDTASFNHSFKRWTGKTPSSFRKLL